MKGCCRYLLTVLSGLLAVQCSVGPVEQAGGDDFPNMIADAGAFIARSLDQQWENPAAAGVDPSSLAQPSLPSIPTSAGPVGKRSLLDKTRAADSLWFGIDPEKGLFTLFSRKDTAYGVKYDTLVFKVSGTDTMIVSFSGAVTTKTLPVVERYRYTDYDGDSLLYSGTTANQQIQVMLQRTGPTGRVETSRFVMDAGPDGDFATESDNRILFAEALVTDGEDTVSAVGIHDGDGDGFVLDNSYGGDSCLVDLFTVTSAATALAPLRCTTVKAKMVVFPADSTKNYAIGYEVENRFYSRTVYWTVLNRNGDSAFYTGDTVDVFRITIAEDDSLECDTMRLAAVMGENPRDSLDDSLLGIYLHVRYRRGSEREVSFDYTAQTPIPSGGTPQEGTVYYKSTLRDGAWIEVNGSIGDTGITAEVTLSGDKRYAVTWDSEGNVLTVEPL